MVVMLFCSVVFYKASHDRMCWVITLYLCYEFKNEKGFLVAWLSTKVFIYANQNIFINRGPALIRV